MILEKSTYFLHYLLMKTIIRHVHRAADVFVKNAKRGFKKAESSTVLPTKKSKSFKQSVSDIWVHSNA